MYGGGASSQPNSHWRVCSRYSRDDDDRADVSCCGDAGLESWYAGVGGKSFVDVPLLDVEDLLLPEKFWVVFIEELRRDMFSVNC